MPVLAQIEAESERKTVSWNTKSVATASNTKSEHMNDGVMDVELAVLAHRSLTNAHTHTKPYY